MLLNLLKTMRPRQWIKNLLVFIPLVFTIRQYWRPFSPEMYLYFGKATAAFLLFCAFSGVIYLLNDIVDVDKDRAHPTKRLRPLASGALSRGQAVAAMVVLLILAVPLSF